MKVKPLDYLGLALTRASDEFRKAVTSDMLVTMGRYALAECPALLTPEMLMQRRRFTERILSTTGWDHYLLSDKAREIAETIKVEKDFNYGLLRTLRKQQSCYLLGKNEFFRFYVEPDGIPAAQELHKMSNANFSGITILHMSCDHEEESIIRTTFNIDFEEGIISLENLEDYHWQLAQRLLRLIIFVEMSEPEIVVVENGATGRRNPAKPWESPLKNLSGVTIRRVHSDWNKFIVHTSEIGVKGFLRLQACGPQYSLRRLVWVKAHTRKGFIRRAKGATSLS